MDKILEWAEAAPGLIEGLDAARVTIIIACIVLAGALGVAIFKR